MTRLPYALLALGSTILLLACSTAGGASPTPAPASLDGRTFLSTAIEGAALVPATQVRLSFTDGGLGANAGCNTMGGQYAIDGNQLTTTQLSMTEMGCDEPLMRQDTWLAAFLTDVTFTLEGDTLLLSDGTIRLTLTDKEVATPDLSLEGTRWVLDGIVSGDAVSSVPMGVTAAIAIDGTQVSVEAGCNTGGGSVEITANTITFGPIATTKMACEPGPMSVETAVLAVLSGPVAYTIDAERLTLDAGGAGLTFRAAESPQGLASAGRTRSEPMPDRR